MTQLGNLESHIFDLIAKASDQMHLFMADLRNGDFSRWSKAAVDYFGLPGEYIQNTAKVWAEYIHPEDRHIFEEDMARIFSGDSTRHQCEYRMRNAAGQYVWVRCRGSADQGPDGKPNLFAGVLINLGSISRFDPTTGLLNTHEFTARLDSALRRGESGAIMLFGLDNFTRVNDIYGFASGDEILHFIAQGMREIVNGTFFRMDGDKIACLLFDCCDSDINDTFERVRNIPRALPSFNDENLLLTLSCGCVHFPNDGTQVNVLRAKAEYGLELAKKNHHGSLAYYSEPLHQESVSRFRLQKALHHAIANDFQGFSLNYQPLIRERDGSVFGAEALLRFSSPDLPFVSPADFIPILENDGSINEVGAWVLRTALGQAALWRKCIPDFCVSVNVSYLQLCAPGFRETVLQTLDDSGVPPEGLILELTESCRFTATSELQSDFHFFADHHIRVALDDFGTGYSSIAVMRALTPPWIKIDHTFVSSLTENALDEAIIEYLLQLCTKAGIEVCVEGIETQDILRIVRQYQPQLLQGYYFSKPLSAADFQHAYIDQSAPPLPWLDE